MYTIENIVPKDIFEKLEKIKNLLKEAAMLEKEMQALLS